MENVYNDRYKDRWVYNTDFHDAHLLDVENVQKLISMYRFTKPNVLFSDVVKKTAQSHTRTREAIPALEPCWNCFTNPNRIIEILIT